MIPLVIEVLGPDGSTEETITLSYLDLPAPPLEVGGRQRVKKTVYPKRSAGQSRVTMQALGAEEDDITLQGVWKDRYQGDGHAAEMTEKLDGVRYSGKPVRMSYDNVSVEGIVTEFKPAIRTKHDVRWSLTVMVGESAFAKIKTVEALDRSAEVEAGIQAALTEMESLDDLVEESGELFELGGVLAEFIAVVDEITAAIAEAIEFVESAIAIIQQVVNLASVAIGVINKVRAFIAKAFLAVKRIQDQIADLCNSAWQAVTTDPVAYLSGVTFAREVAALARAIRQHVLAAQIRAALMAAAPAAKTHTIGAGDTLIKVAKLYYKDPLGWRRIAEANGLKGLDLGSATTLVIP